MFERKRKVARDLHEPVQAKHLETTLEQNGGDTEKMIKKFLKKVKLEGILQLAVEKSRYTKPSEAKRKKAIVAKQRTRSDNF